MLWIWIGFILFVLTLLALDLGVLNRKAHVIGVKEALGWSAMWVSLALLFTIFVYFAYQNHWGGLGLKADAIDGRPNDGPSAAMKYLTGYIVEESLSADNMFVIAMLFGFFGIPAIYQHRVLFWGIMGALIMRGMMIGVGAALVARFHWILYIFGAFLIFTAVKMLVMNTEETDPNANIVVRLTRRLFPVTQQFHGEHFVVRAGSVASRKAAVPGAAALEDKSVDSAKPGTWMLTPLAVALVMIECTDLVFAVDSIPAVFAITTDPFLVFTSNVFAILGLRSLYFALAGMIDKFRYLKISLAIVLAVVGAKMLAAPWLKETLGKNASFYLLGLIVAILAAGIAASIIADSRKPRTDAPASS
jgi:tellurite resistance protein TerC